MKNLYAFILFFLLCYSTSFGQTSDGPEYSVMDIGLAKKIGQMDHPDTNPQYEGGMDELTKYFAANPLKHKDAADVKFRSHIYFWVDTNGQARDFDLLYRNLEHRRRGCCTIWTWRFWRSFLGCRNVGFQQWWKDARSIVIRSFRLQ